MRRQASALAPRCDARDCLQQIGFCSTSAQAFQEADQGIHLMDPKSKVRNAVAACALSRVAARDAPDAGQCQDSANMVRAEHRDESPRRHTRKIELEPRTS